jgi:branched-chain amino acid transport system permease protein
MHFNALPDVIAGSIVLAGTYTLVALGWVLLVRASRLFNFATGQFMALGAYVTYALASRGLNFYVSVLAGLLIMSGLAGLTYRGVIRPLVGRPLFSAVIVSLGLATMLTPAMMIIWGPVPIRWQVPFNDSVYHLPAGIVLSLFGIVTAAVGGVFWLLVTVFMRYTRIGVQMRAASENALLASQLGIPVDLIFVLGWALSACAVTLAGTAQAIIGQLSPGLAELGLLGIAPAMLGGLDSIRGAIVGSFLVAVIQGLLTLYGTPQLGEVGVWAIILLVLLVRPYGLFGTPAAARA